jgi:hypothetical protein
MRTSSFVLALIALIGIAGCSEDSPGTWTLSEAKASITTDNHVAVDIVYVNSGEEDWAGARCVLVEWHTGTVLTREDARAQRPSTSVVVESQRWCNGGNKSLPASDRDLFRAVSGGAQSALAGTTIVVVAEAFKGKPTDDRLTIPSP